MKSGPEAAENGTVFGLAKGMGGGRGGIRQAAMAAAPGALRLGDDVQDRRAFRAEKQDLAATLGSGSGGETPLVQPTVRQNFADTAPLGRQARYAAQTEPPRSS